MQIGHNCRSSVPFSKALMYNQALAAFILLSRASEQGQPHHARNIKQSNKRERSISFGLRPNLPKPCHLWTCCLFLYKPTSEQEVIGNSVQLWYFAEMWISFDGSSELWYLSSERKYYQRSPPATCAPQIKRCQMGRNIKIRTENKD